MADDWTALSSLNYKPHPKSAWEKLTQATHTTPAVNAAGHQGRAWYANIAESLKVPGEAAMNVLGTPQRAVTGALAGGLGGAVENVMHPEKERGYLNQLESKFGADKLEGPAKMIVDFAVETGLDPLTYTPMVAGRILKAFGLSEHLGEQLIAKVGDMVHPNMRGNAFREQHFGTGNDQNRVAYDAWMEAEQRKLGEMKQTFEPHVQAVGAMSDKKQAIQHATDLIANKYMGYGGMQNIFNKAIKAGKSPAEALNTALSQVGQGIMDKNVGMKLATEGKDWRFTQGVQAQALKKAQKAAIKADPSVDPSSVSLDQDTLVNALAKANAGIKAKGGYNIPGVTPVGNALSRLTRAMMFVNPFPHALTNVLPLLYMSHGIGGVMQGLKHYGSHLISGKEIETPEMLEGAVLPNIFGKSATALDKAPENPVARGIENVTTGTEKAQDFLHVNKFLNNWEAAMRRAAFEGNQKKVADMGLSGKDAIYKAGQRTRQDIGDYGSVPSYVRGMQKVGGVFPQYHNFIVPTAVGRSVIRNPQRLEQIFRGQEVVNRNEPGTEKGRYWTLGGVANNAASMPAKGLGYLSNPSSLGPALSALVRMSAIPGFTQNAITQDTQYGFKNKGEVLQDSLLGFMPAGLDKPLGLHELMTGQKSKENIGQKLLEQVTGAYPVSRNSADQIQRWINWVKNGGGIQEFKNSAGNKQGGY